MTTSTVKKFFIWLYFVLGTALVFSLLCLSFSFDISLLAFPVSLLFAGVMAYYVITLKRNDNIHAIPVVRKMIQYLPYVLLTSFVLRRAGSRGTHYWYDVVTVVLWCIVFIGSLVVSYYMNEKRVYSLKKEWEDANKNNLPAKRKGGVHVLYLKPLTGLMRFCRLSLWFSLFRFLSFNYM